MAIFQTNAITERGILLRTHVDMGAVFTATKIVIGSGYIPSGKTAKTMTDVVAPVKELAINKKERTPNGMAIFGGAYTNEDITTEFYFRELALYAKAVYPDGTEVEEVLYSYGNAAGSAELMAAYSTSTVVERQLDIVTYVGNDAQIDLTIESGLYIPRDEKGAPGGVAALDENGVLAAEHRSQLLTNEDLNDIIVEGYYRARLSHECVNVPDDVTGFGLLVLRIGENMANGGNCNQILVPYGSVGNIIYTRIGTEGAWDNWRRLALEDKVVRKVGDEISGELQFVNFGDFYMLRKGRTLPDGKTHFLTMGLSSGGSTTLEHYTCDTQEFDGTKLDGRLELGQVAGENDWLNTFALVLRADNANGPTYRIYGEHFSPTVVATAELV